MRRLVTLLTLLSCGALGLFLGRAPESMTVHDPNGAPEHIAYDVIHATGYHLEDDPRRYFEFSPNDECTHDGEAIQGSRLIGDTWHVDIRQECIKGKQREITMEVKENDGSWRIQVPASRPASEGKPDI